MALDDKYLQSVMGTFVRINQCAAAIGPGDGTTWRLGFVLFRSAVDIHVGDFVKRVMGRRSPVAGLAGG